MRSQSYSNVVLVKIVVLFLLTVLLAPGCSAAPPTQLATDEPLGRADDTQAAGLEQRPSTDPENIEALLELATVYAERALGNDAEALDKADSLLARACVLEPENSVALARHGMVNALKARDAEQPMLKLEYVQRGLGLVDKAVALDPHNVTVRMVRGRVCMSLPPMFGRSATAIEDFSHILGMAEARPEAFDAELLTEIHLALAQFYRATNQPAEARAHCRSIIEIAPKSSVAAQAEEILVAVGK